MKNKKEPLPIIKGAKDLNKVKEIVTKYAVIIATILVIAGIVGLIVGVLKEIIGGIILIGFIIVNIIKNKLN